MVPSKLTLICSIACSLIGVSVQEAVEEVQINIPQGALKGVKSTTVLNGKPFYTFSGIPYAKIRVDEDGANRFKVSEPPESWSGVYDATKERSRCISFCPMQQKIVGDDECLFLNVYTPELNKNARKAVMVWFHGGGFNMGMASTVFFGPDFLVEHDVVLVTLNYRLGVFGFLGTEDSASPGNVGLKDQTAALKWVQENIENFGGCPKRVTIFGTSAGGASVQFHMASPMSAGLFRQAISQSGSMVSPWAMTYHPRDAALKLGKILGIETKDSAELVEALGRLPSNEIFEAAMSVDKTENMMSGHSYAFVPCVEPDIPGEEIFLPTDPWELIKNGKLADVPYIAGVTLNETIFMKKALFEASDSMNKNFENFLPEDLNISDSSERKSIADSVRNFYLDGKELTKDSLLEYAKMTMDVSFANSVQMTTTIINSLKSSPTFNYLFAYESPYGFSRMAGIYDGKEGGVTHADESSYLFYVGFSKLKPERGSTDEKITRLMTKLWTNFAKTGNPTSEFDDVVTVNWEPVGNEHNYALIDKDFTMEKNMFKERIDFWVEIYKKILGDNVKLF